jgi:hypothetical protein
VRHLRLKRDILSHAAAGRPVSGPR